MAHIDAPLCPKCKQNLTKLSEDATHVMWACPNCQKGYQLPKK